MAGPWDKSDLQNRAPAAGFTASELRDRSVRAEIEKERAAVDAKTARLKALRLAREAEEAAKAAANPKLVKATAAKSAKAARKKS